MKQVSTLLCTAAAAEGSSKRWQIWAEFGYDRNRKDAAVCLQRGCCSVISFTKTPLLTYYNRLAGKAAVADDKKKKKTEQIITARTGR